MFAIGFKGQYLDPLAPPQIQVEICTEKSESVTSWPFLGQDDL
jgi:hypothetical protein